MLELKLEDQGVLASLECCAASEWRVVGVEAVIELKNCKVSVPESNLGRFADRINSPSVAMKEVVLELTLIKSKKPFAEGSFLKFDDAGEPS